MGKPFRQGLDRARLTTLYDAHGSWSAVAEVLKMPRATIDGYLQKAGLLHDVTLNRAAARLRVTQDHQWVLDKDEFRRRLQKHGGINPLAVAESMSHATVSRYVEKHGLTPADWTPDPADFGVTRYDTPLVLTGDWAIASDFQAPFTSRTMVSLLCKVSRAWGINDLLLAGDFADLHTFSKHDPLTEQPSWDNTKAYLKRLISTLRDAFSGRIIWFLGNHEARLPRWTQGKWSLAELASVIEATDRGVQVEVAPKVFVDSPRGKWMVIHPKSFSVIPTAVARDLAVKHKCHVICAHGHGVGFARDRSGTYECYDIGGMFDPGALDYPNLLPTRHPEMRQGFAMLRQGHCYLFQPDSDYSLWERAGRAG